ncbi:uncharacterized protein AB675_7219 [Cyphellophora attinorum]|uniref:Uncharacterized protein n=1 Tax=Cyphellophora attinorum TaxID=1664694 RepID=A0A0N0NHU5_9EURO|nr:uncharacterized protein AB675_7219 [Phialophora attinorum]KPI35081.1 hypothetical protein AB675_7219 [Phialophora attinorum]
MADASQWTPPNNDGVFAQGRFPGIAQIVTEQNPPTKVCYRIAQNNDDLPDIRPGDWTPYKSADDLTDNEWKSFKNIVFVVSRHGPEDYGEKDDIDRPSCWAANAIVAARVQEGVHQDGIQNQVNKCMQGPTLCICCDLEEAEAEFQKPMPAYPMRERTGDNESFSGSNNYPMLIPTMEKLESLYTQPDTSDNDKPNIHFVSRSIFSLAFSHDPWGGFLWRFKSWHNKLYLVYQFRQDWEGRHIVDIKYQPTTDRPLQNAIPYVHDPIYAIKFLAMPLKAFATGGRPGRPAHPQADPGAPARPAWEANVHHWLSEEFNAREACMSPNQAEQVIARGQGRLLF